MYPILLEEGLKLVGDELRAAITSNCFWDTEVLEQLGHRVIESTKAVAPAFPM